MTETSPIRVRQLLSALNSVEKAELKKLLPRGIATKPPAEPEGTRYPSALLAQLPAGDQYSLAGHITEALLRFSPAACTVAQLCATTRTFWPLLTAEQEAKIVASKTTEPFLNHIRETRKKLRFVARGEFAYDTVVGGDGPVQGHPDIRTPTQLFEVKMTGQLKQNWVSFLFQLFAYAALDSAATDAYLVLPLQEIVWHYPLASWTTRAAYRDALHTAAAKADTSGATNIAAFLLLQAHLIGCHMPKLKTLADTMHSLPLDRPSQIFLAGTQTSRITIQDADIANAASIVAASGRRVFVHSPYIINLCSPPGQQDDYHTALLIKNLQIGAAFGARGVVVHVGKSTSQPLDVAMAHMRTNILTALGSATPECPVLLETPAGQGSEVLRTWEEFAAFVAAIGDPRLRICVDTCHVFACGHDPRTYLRRFLTEHPGLTRLIHFNDSATPCGSCLDRHAFVGRGHIGVEALTEVAEAATGAAVPMVVE
jgi:deoxyribonuclease-4